MKKIKWYYNRAKIMSLKEVIHRINCSIYNKKIKKNYKIKVDEYTLNYFKLPQFDYFNDLERKKIINIADKILEDKVIIFNKEIKLHKEDKFITDPITNKKWNKMNQIIGSDNNDLPGDPKLIWEINKQQYLLDLAVAFAITNDEKYADKVIEDINQWIAENPEYVGINWASGLEMSLRCLSWIYSLNILKKYIENRNVYLETILHSLRVQADYIYHRLSLYSSANNHLIGELALLLHASLFLECKESSVWKTKAKKMLNKQVLNQFYKDGINKEQSVNYQIHTMELYFLSQYILEKYQDGLDLSTLKVLECACKYLYDLSENNGTIFNIGDEDGGHILKLQLHISPVLDVLQLGALILNKYDLYGSKEKGISIKNLILFGTKYEEFLNYSSNINQKGNEFFLYSEGGMYIRNGEINDIKYKLSFDFGNIGMGPLYAHAHSDILGININIEQKPFLIDTGTYKYHLDEGFRDYFRGVSGHNTISINNKNHFDFLGKFMCSKSPYTKLTNIAEESILCSSNIYKKEKCNVSRELVFKNNRITIHDSIKNKSKKSKSVTIYFNFDKNVKLNKEKQNYICNLDNTQVLFEIDSKLNATLKYGKNSEREILGWQSKSFYSKEPTHVIVLNTVIPPKTIVNFKNTFELILD